MTEDLKFQRPLVSDALLGKSCLQHYFVLPSGKNTLLVADKPFFLVDWTDDHCKIEYTDKDDKEVSVQNNHKDYITSTVGAQQTLRHDGQVVEVQRNIPVSVYEKAIMKMKKEQSFLSYSSVEGDDGRFYLKMTRVNCDDKKTPLIDLRKTESMNVEFPANTKDEDVLKNIRSSIEQAINIWNGSDTEDPNPDYKFLNHEKIHNNPIALTMLSRNVARKEFMLGPNDQITKLTSTEIDDFIAPKDIYNSDVPSDRKFIFPMDEDELDIFMEDLVQVRDLYLSVPKTDMFSIQPKNHCMQTLDLHYYTDVEEAEDDMDVDQ